MYFVAPQFAGAGKGLLQRRAPWRRALRAASQKADRFRTNSQIALMR